jgi:hypothetical protein
MISQSEVRRELIAYLKNLISLADFENWLLAKSWNMHIDSDQDTVDLVDDIEISLAEYSNSYLTLQDLHMRLQDAAKTAITTMNANASVLPRYFKNASSSQQTFPASFVVPA